MSAAEQTVTTDHGTATLVLDESWHETWMPYRWRVIIAGRVTGYVAQHVSEERGSESWAVLDEDERITAEFADRDKAIGRAVSEGISRLAREARKAQADLTAAEASVAEARAYRDGLVRALAMSGRTAYWITQQLRTADTDLAESTVGRIIKR